MRTGLIHFASFALAACQMPPPASPVLPQPVIAAAGKPAAAIPPAPLIAEPRKPSAPLLIDRLPADFPHGGEARAAEDIDLIVIHTIGGAVCRKEEIVFSSVNGSAGFWRDWFVKQTDKSIHYVIGRDGEIAQQRPDLRTAGHVSARDVLPDVNLRSIGIELVNRGDGMDPFPPEQIAAATQLAANLAGEYGILPQNIVTHASLDLRMQPDCGGKKLRRNVDPGPLFPLDGVRAAITAVR